MISLSPSTIDFGEVVTKTPCDRSITIVNNYQGDVLVQIKNEMVVFHGYLFYCTRNWAIIRGTRCGSTPA